jgi:hypothetical protein
MYAFPMYAFPMYAFPMCVKLYLRLCGMGGVRRPLARQSLAHTHLCNSSSCHTWARILDRGAGEIFCREMV